jgi:hypothetical protein
MTSVIWVLGDKHIVTLRETLRSFRNLWFYLVRIQISKVILQWSDSLGRLRESQKVKLSLRLNTTSKEGSAAKLRILHHSTKRMWVMSFTPRPFNSLHRLSLIRSLRVPQTFGHRSPLPAICRKQKQPRSQFHPLIRLSLGGPGQQANGYGLNIRWIVVRLSAGGRNFSLLQNDQTN